MLHEWNGGFVLAVVELRGGGGGSVAVALVWGGKAASCGGECAGCLVVSKLRGCW